MGIRVSSQEVKGIITTSLTDLGPFIKAASKIVDVLAVRDTDGLLDNATLKEIERWLSAHALSMTKEPQVKQEQIGDAAITYQGTIGVGKGFEATYYGQMALSLDVTGKLQSLGKRRAQVKTVDLDL